MTKNKNDHVGTETHSWSYRYGMPMVRGATANLFATFATLPLHRSFVVLQTAGNTRSYGEILHESFTLNGIRLVYSASGHVLRMAPLQSFAYLGISNLVFEMSSPEDSPWLKGLKAGLFSAQAESAVAAWKLPKILSAWSSNQVKSYTVTINRHLAFARCYQASLTKNSIANTLTLTGKLVIEGWLEDWLPNLAQPYRSALAGMLGAAGAGVIFAPFVLLETRMHQDPSKSYGTHARGVKSPLECWNGAGARIFQKSIAAGVAFFTIEKLKSADLAPLIQRIGLSNK